MLTCFFPNTWAFILCIFSGNKVNCISVLLWVTPNAPQQRSLYVSCRGEHSLFLDESTVLCRATSLSPDSQFLAFMSPPPGVYDQVLYLSHDYKKQSIWGILSYLCLPLSCLFFGWPVFSEPSLSLCDFYKGKWHFRKYIVDIICFLRVCRVIGHS